MQGDELKEKCRMNFPIVSWDSKSILEKCKRKEFVKDKGSNKVRYLKYVLFALFICFISVGITLLVQNLEPKVVLGGNIVPVTPYNVDMGKDSFLAKEGHTQEEIETIKKNNPGFDFKFDRMIAWGPELATGEIDLKVLLNSNLICETDKEILKEYASKIRKKYMSRAEKFQIGLLMKDGKDYIYLINHCGYDKETQEEVINELTFKSDLSYSFTSIIDRFEEMLGVELTDKFLNGVYYDAQNILSNGIIINFIEKDNGYQEYYICKIDGNIYLLK